MKNKAITIIFFLLFLGFSSWSQNIVDWIETNEKVPVEKIYLHTDADFYFQSDTVWFKVYLMDSRSGKLIPGAENVFVNIIDKNGKSVIETILLSINGQASGFLPIPRMLGTGNYILQAFTNYLLSFSDYAWFQKPISISRIPSYAGNAINDKRPKGIISDVNFFPEGGNLLENVTNLVAFKAIDRAGYGVETAGTVRDNYGNVVASFKTDYKGMGLFFLTPETGKSYYARVNGLPSFRYDFKVQKENLKIQLVNHTSNEIILNISSNAENFRGQNFYLACMYRGEVKFYHPFKMEGLNQVLKFESKILNSGINRLVLLNNQLIPISERLLFSQNVEINFLNVQSDKNIYDSRKKVILKLKDSDKNDPDNVSNLSLSVINKNALEEGDKLQNILSYLLIDSEINGFYDPSVDFFIDNQISSEAKLRLLMLTNGWSSYFWNSVPSKNDSLKFQQKAGLDISGRATNILTEKPLVNGGITMVVQKNGEVAFLSQETDREGKFKFPGLLYKDTATIHIQAKNVKGGMNTKIEVGTAFENYKISPQNLTVTKENFYVPARLLGLKAQSNQVKRRLRLFNLRKKQNPQTERNTTEHFRIYEEADFVLEIKENEESFENIIDFMVGKVPGVDVSGNEVRIRGTSNFGASSSPLFLVDGVPLIANNTFGMPDEFSPVHKDVETDIQAEEQLIQTVKSIPLNDVDKIEVLKSPQNLAAFGINGANGVIAIYTRIGKQGVSDKVARGVIEKQIVGYASKREFYSPKYTPDTKPKLADYRTTLFWNPDVITIKGVAEMEFYTSDQEGKFVIHVEGITEDGKICLGISEFEVVKK